MNNRQEKSCILFDKVSKFYHNKLALNELSFSVYENEFVALLGNNACGKTTAINILCNLIPYDEGAVYIFGAKVTPSYINFKTQVGIVLSAPYYIPEFSVIDYLSFVGEFQLLDKKEIKTRLNDLLPFFALDEHKFKAIKDLSSGNKMKTSIAAALIHNPKILIFDEPFVNLDVKTTQTLIEILTTFRGRKTLLITSHDLDLVIDLCDRFLLMNNGSILTEITHKEGLSSNELKATIRRHLMPEPNYPNEIKWLI